MFLRGQNGGARAVVQYKNLSNLDFKEQDVSQADFTGSAFLESNLSYANFSGTTFFACDMRNADMKGGNFRRADFRGAFVAGADLSQADMTDADMREGKIMKRGQQGALEDRKRSGGDGAKTVFTGAKLSETNMSGVQAKSADFSDADLSGTILEDSNMEGVNFKGANLTDADFTDANMAHTDLSSSVMAGTIMDGAEKQNMNITGCITEKDMGDKLENLGKTLPELLEEHTLWVSTAGARGRQLDLSGYDLRDILDLRKFPLTAIKAIEANFLNQNLQSAELQGGTFDRSDFRDCKMLDADLRGSSFKYAQFTRADLSDAQLCPLQFDNPDGSKRLQRVDLSGANLRYAVLRDVDLRDCILMGVDLTSAILSGCDLRRADLTGAILTGAIFDNVRLGDTIIDLESL